MAAWTSSSSRVPVAATVSPGMPADPVPDAGFFADPVPTGVSEPVAWEVPVPFAAGISMGRGSGSGEGVAAGFDDQGAEQDAKSTAEAAAIAAVFMTEVLGIGFPYCIRTALRNKKF